MSVLLRKILWFRSSAPNDSINLTDAIDMNVGRGMDIKNNVVTMTLKNSAQGINSNQEITHKYVDEDGNVMFEEQDQIKVYLKYTDDMADVDSIEWNNDPSKFNADITTEPSGNTDLKGVYYVIDFNVVTDIKSTPIKLKCADKTYILFNRLLVEAFTKAEGLTSPTALQKVVRFSSENKKGAFIGTGEDGGVIYDVDARLTTETTGGDGSGEAGFIQAARKATAEDGTANADLVFPDIALSKIWKPVYEWINELSQIEYLNTGDELDGTLPIVYGRPFLYFVDEENKFHWFETDNVVSETIVIGTTTGIYNYKLDKKVFDTVNFIVFRGGEDFFGKGTLDYHLEETSNIKTRRMRVIAMVDIAKNLIQAEEREGNLVSNTSGTFTFGGNRFNRNGTVTALWNNTEYSADAAYNTALKVEILRQGKARARSLVKGLANARYKGSIERKGTIQTVGALLNVTNKKTGQSAELIRVMDVRDVINKKGWFTTMQIEQDQEAIIKKV